MKRFLTLITLVATLQAGCSAIVTRPDVRLQKISPSSLDTSGIDLEVNLLVTNPNSFDLTLLGYSYALSLASTPVASGGVRQKVVFAGKKETVLKIPTRVRHGSVVELLKKKPDLNHLPYSLEAGLQIDSPIGELSVPINAEGDFAVPENYRPSSVLHRLKGIFR